MMDDGEFLTDENRQSQHFPWPDQSHEILLKSEIVENNYNMKTGECEAINPMERVRCECGSCNPEKLRPTRLCNYSNTSGVKFAVVQPGKASVIECKQ